MNYLNLIKKGIKNLPSITEGYANALKAEYDLLDETTIGIANERLKICLECPFNSDNAINIGYENKDNINYFHCSSCGCPIKKKVLSLSSNCGLENFLINPEAEDVIHILKYYKTNNESIQLKWKKQQK